MHFIRQLSCWSLRCSWSITCRRCSNYIFILNLTPGFDGLGKDNYKMRRDAFKFWNLVQLILETLRYVWIHFHIMPIKWDTNGHYHKFWAWMDLSVYLTLSKHYAKIRKWTDHAWNPIDFEYCLNTLSWQIWDHSFLVFHYSDVTWPS